MIGQSGDEGHRRIVRAALLELPNMRLGDADRLGHLLERFPFFETETGEARAEAHWSQSDKEEGGSFDRSDDNMRFSCPQDVFIILRSQQYESTPAGAL